MDPTFGILSALIYDGLKHGKSLVGPGFYGVLVDVINDTNSRYPDITLESLVEFFSNKTIENMVKAFKEKQIEPNLQSIEKQFADFLKKKKIKNKAEEILRFFFYRLEDSIISKPEIFDKINLTYLRRIEKTIKDESTKMILLQEETLKKLTEYKIQNEFDLQKYDRNTVLSNLSQIAKSLNNTDPYFNYNIKIDDQNTTLQILPKNNKKPLMFTAKLKLKNEKAKAVKELIKANNNKEIEINGNEIEEILISQDGEVIESFPINSLSKLTIKQNQPIPFLVNLYIPNTDQRLDYILLKPSKLIGNKILLSNTAQKYAPIEVKIELDWDTKEGKLTLSANTDVGGIIETYNYAKIMNALSREVDVIFEDIRNTQKMIIFHTKKKTPHVDKFTFELIEKAVEIQKQTGVKLPWPPDIITPADTHAILNTYQAITKGELSGSFRSNGLLHKNEKAAPKTMKSLKEKGFMKGKIRFQQTSTLFGKVIPLGWVTIEGKFTTDDPPLDVIEKYEKLDENGTMQISFISLEGKSKFKFDNWPLRSSKDNK